MSRSVVICADDFGMSSDINAAILELIDNGRLSATSCMTTMPHWTVDAARELVARRSKAALGLHFNLTEGEDSISLGKLMLHSLSGTLDRYRVRTQLELQLDNFESLVGSAPDFVDGHQHIQMFPVIRTIFLDTLQKRYGQSMPWVRVSTPALSGHDSGFKALILRLIGLGFDRARRRAGIPGNTAFAGMYSLTPEADFGGMMRRWLASEPDGVLIMCHPARKEAGSALSRARQREYHWLAGNYFTEGLIDSKRLLSTKPALD
ncbi:ChbG/HpnK family deacetylase [Marinobacterium sp. YM272]|uniref:ChbG/HpnK family deacetylase n=1 Tax=Marinobacterium sp. YM272 TaxID=3421654 RepID=UPI003D7FA8F4